MTVRNYTLGFLFVAMFIFAPFAHAEALLSPEETLWLRQRNNTIVVYPEQNNPPFSYQSPSGVIQGLSVDYIELIAKKVGASVQYLTPRSRSQILSDARAGRGDVILSLAPTQDRTDQFVFTESYVTVPFVIVVRKDLQSKSTTTLADYVGKQVAVTQGSVIENYIRQNYPRVVVEDVTDDEAALQQVVLGQVGAATMDVASLSYLLSKQVLSSVKVVGTVGYDYEPSFAMTKDKEILQSILEKGLAQISTDDRQTLADKWIALPKERVVPTFFKTTSGMFVLYIFATIAIIGGSFLLLRRRVPAWRHIRKNETVSELHEELHELAEANEVLTAQLEDVKQLEEDIEGKLKKLGE